MSESRASEFDRLMDPYKRLILLRENECEELREIFLREAKRQARLSTLSKTFLIIAGALVATKGVSDLLMIKMHWPDQVEMIILIIYTVIGVSVAIIAGLDAAFRFESKAARLNYLATMCQNHNRTYMADYLKYLSSSSNKSIIQQRILDLIDKHNSDLEQIHAGANNVGVNTGEIKTRFSVADIR